MFLKTEARQFKEKAKLFMPPRTLPPLSRLSLEVKVYAPWLTKTGSLRRLDIQNLEKILIDAIAEKYDFDDSRIFVKRSEKIQADKEEVWVTLRETDTAKVTAY